MARVAMPRQRLLAGVTLVAAVVGLHGLLWSRLGEALGDFRSGADVAARLGRSATSTVRAVPRREPAGSERPASSRSRDSTLRAVPVPADAHRPDRLMRPATTRAHRGSALPPAMATRVAPAPEAPQAPQPARGDPPPQYAARLPDATRLSLRVWRGEQRLGEATLDWWHDAARYRLQLSWAGEPPPAASLIEQVSSGRVGPHGLLPERFVDRRARRGARAVSLQCDGEADGGVTFSAATAHAPCVAGMQDGLSWWLQLWAIVAARPVVPESGTAFSVAVARLHGVVEMWTFVVEPEADASAIKLARHPDRLPQFDDLTAELWLDAAPPHALRRVRVQSTRGESLVWERLEPAMPGDS